REPVCFLLPTRHRRVLLPLAASPIPQMTWSNGISIAVSIMLGAWTHIFWDALTHRDMFFVKHIPALKARSFLEMPVFYWLQHFSTLVGMLVLLIAYESWTERATVQAKESAGRDGWRILLLGALAIFSTVLAFPIAYADASVFHGDYASRLFLFRMIVY